VGDSQCATAGAAAPKIPNAEATATVAAALRTTRPPRFLDMLTAPLMSPAPSLA
jgi:hypothetical protein